MRIILIIIINEHMHRLDVLWLPHAKMCIITITTPCKGSDPATPPFASVPAGTVFAMAGVGHGAPRFDRWEEQHSVHACSQEMNPFGNEKDPERALRSRVGGRGSKDSRSRVLRLETQMATAHNDAIPPTQPGC